MRVNEVIKWGNLAEDQPNIVRAYFESRDEYLKFKKLHTDAVNAVESLNYNDEAHVLYEKYGDIAAEASWSHWFDGGAWKKRKDAAWDAYQTFVDSIKTKQEGLYWTFKTSFTTDKYLFTDWLIIPAHWHFGKEDYVYHNIEVFTQDYILLVKGSGSKIENITRFTSDFS